MDSDRTGKLGHAKPVILLLTNLYNGHGDEDIYLSYCLREHFDVILSSIFDCEAVEDDADLILIRNSWPNFNYKKEVDEIKARFAHKGLLTYNPLNGKGDNNGKGYLLGLYKAGYPVLPIVDKVEDLSKLPETDMYFAKPRYKCDNTDTFTATKDQLSSVWLEDFVFQPYLDFACEISFYFIDGEFIYAFYTKKKVGMHDFTEFTPTEEDLKFARQFVEWDNLEYGLVRVDLFGTRDGKLILNELEDFEPFLYLNWVKTETRNKMVDKLIEAIKKRVDRA